MQAGELRGDTVILRLLEQNHLARYCAQLSPSVCAALHMSDIASEYTYLCERLNTQPFLYSIFDKRDDHLIGGLEIRSSDISRGQLYCWLNETYWGSGRFREALALASGEYFKHSNEPFFTAHVDVCNKRSYWALKKCGFADIGMGDGPYGKQYKLIKRRNDHSLLV